MEPVVIRLYYDFASTLCYVAHRVMSEIEDEIRAVGVVLEWCPMDLTMAAPWNRGDSFADDVRDAVRETGIALGVEAIMPDPWLDSRPLSQVAMLQPSLEAEAQWRSSVFASIHESKNPTLSPELMSLAHRLVGHDPLEGLDPYDLEESYPMVEETTREALMLGVTGVPAFLLDNWMVSGIYDGESMVKILAELAQRYREQGSDVVN